MTLADLERELRALSVECFLNSEEATDPGPEDIWHDLHRTIHVIAEHTENLKNQTTE